MTSSQAIVAIQERLGASLRTFGTALGVSITTVGRWRGQAMCDSGAAVTCKCFPAPMEMLEKARDVERRCAADADFARKVRRAVRLLPTPDSLRERFESRIARHENGCWLWTGHVNKMWGYGTLRYKGPNLSAHKLSYELHKGQIPDGLWVLHKCDVRRCVNPDHLYLGDVIQNTKDRVERNRSARGLRNGKHTKPESVARGSRNGFSKLTEARVAEMRQLAASGATGAAIGRHFGVSKSAACRIVKGKTWTHVLAKAVPA